MLSGRKRVSCAEPWERSADTALGSADYEAFVRVVEEALLIVPMRILGDCLMPNHGHFVLWPEWDDQLSAFMHQLAQNWDRHI